MGLLDGLKRGLDDAAAESRTLARLTSLNLDLASLRGRRDAALRDLGRLVLGQIEDEQHFDPTIEDAAAATRLLDKEVFDLERAVELLRAESVTIRAVENALDPKPPATNSPNADDSTDPEDRSDARRRSNTR